MGMTCISHLKIGFAFKDNAYAESAFKSDRYKSCGTQKIMPHSWAHSPICIFSQFVCCRSLQYTNYMGIENTAENTTT